jgi:carboxyl-terminal processing protease
MGKSYVKRRAIGAAALAAACAAPLLAQAPAGLPANDLHKVRTMLREGYETVKKEYYDPAFHGVDLDARFREYDERMKTAPTMGAALTMVAGFLDGLKDSHTYFSPPARSFSIDYGYALSVIGDDVFVTAVTPDTDAAAKVHPGDRLLSLNGGGVGRESFMRMQYLFNTLQPQPATRLALRDPAGAERTVEVTTKVTPGRVVRNLSGAGAGLELQELELQDEAMRAKMRSVHVERDGVMFWKMPLFFAESGEIDALFAIARKQQALVLDLRGNPGGRVDTLLRMVGNLFAEPVTVGTRVTRKGKNLLTAKGRGGDAFTGKVVVLVDAASGSSAELLARVVQLEQRGTVVGDRSAGAVMEARLYPFGQVAPTLILYSFAVTDADLVMKDGRSLEGSGVAPDILAVPTGTDLAGGLDPVLAKAAARAGVTLDAAAAAKLFPRGGA